VLVPFLLGASTCCLSRQEAWLAETAIAWRHLPEASWVHYGFAIVTSAIVALLIQESRVRAAEEIFRLSQREFASRLKRAEALGELHHEINNPLQALGDAAYLIKAGNLTVVPLLQESVERIRRVVHAMDDYIP
jgi:signal transduction histidine kinase